MNWLEVIRSIEDTVRGAELSAKLASDSDHKLEARIVSGVAASLAAALRQGLENRND